MMQGAWKQWPGQGYLVAILATALAAVLHGALSSVMAGSYLTFFPAVVVAAAWGGLGPGLLATGVSALLVDLFLDASPKVHLGDPAALGRMVLFLLGGGGVSLLAAGMHAAQAHQRRQARDIAECFQLLDLARVLVWDLDGRITRWNTGCRQLYGFTSQQALGQNCHQLLQTRFPEPLEVIHARLLEAGHWEGELVQTTAEGRELSVTSQWVLWWDSAGQPAGVLETNTDVTARKQAEREVRENHALLQAVLEGVTDAVYVKDSQGRYRILNTAGAQRLGHSVAEVIGCDDATLVGVEAATELRSCNEQVMSEGRLLTFEETHDWCGSPHIYLTTEGPHRDAQGRIVGILGISRDITERRRAEETSQRLNAELEQRATALAEQSRRAYELLHAIFEGSQDLIAAMDTDFRYIAFNQAYRELLQRSFGFELQVGHTLFEAIAIPEEQQAVHALWARAMQGESFTVERELADHRYYQIRYSPIRDSEGKLLGAADFLRDVSDRKQAEEALQRAHDELELRVRQRTAELELTSQALRESEERFRAFMDNSPTIAWAKDEHGRLVYWNRAFEQRFNLRRDEWHGKSDEPLWPAATAQRFRQSEATVLRSGQALEGIDELPNCQGGRSWWWNFRFPFQDAHGTRYVGSVGVDITERQQAEEELRRLYADLERRVEERTAELAAANHELEAFTYSVSHDLRAPLRHVTGYVQLLERHAGPVLDETGLRYMRTITEAGRRMGNLIDDLLVLSRLGRVPLTDAMVPLSPLVEEIQHELASETAGRTIEWHIGPLPEVCGDPTLLRSVLMNLLSNAVKFSRHRQPARIEVGAEERPDEVVCFVRDNGAGFDMRFVDQLFQAFQRLHHVEEFEGTGIGLASVHRIIQRHGGRTWAEGAVDRGATFYFSLPMRKSRP